MKANELRKMSTEELVENDSLLKDELLKLLFQSPTVLLVVTNYLR